MTEAHAAPRLSRTRRVLYIAGAILVTAALAAGGLELGLRLFAPQPGPMRWLVPDARYGHRMRPNFHQRYPFLGTDFVMDVQTNAHGLRDEEIRPEEDGERTVVFVGDSVTFGHGLNVGDRFDTLLDEKLEEAGYNYRLINTGTNAWGTLQETRFIRDHFDDFEPDIIVVTFTGNDPSDDAYFRRKGQSFDEIMFPGKRFLRNHSHLYRLATRYAFIVYHSFTVRRRQRNDAPAVLDTHSGSLITDEQWQSTRAILRNFDEAFRNYNPDGRVLIQPAAPQNAELAEKLRQLAAELDWTFVDMSAAVEDLPPEALRLPYDGHWSKRLHRISAKFLYERLSDPHDVTR